MTKQHKALELADGLEVLSVFMGDPRPRGNLQDAADELRRLHAMIVQMREATRYLLSEVWSDRHSHMSEEQFDADFSEEKVALAAANEYLEQP